jgi:hypothetical protein
MSEGGLMCHVIWYRKGVVPPRPGPLEEKRVVSFHSLMIQCCQAT